MHRMILIILISLILIAGCSGVDPTATPLPPSPTPVPTDVPTAAPTATLVPTDAPPTDTPAPTPIPTAEPAARRGEIIKDVSYFEGRNVQQKLDLYLPETGNGEAPTLFAMHGGGGDKTDLASLAHHFAGQGYAVVAINYRDMPTHGYPAPLQDAFCALAWTHAHAEAYGLDPERVFALGHSVGGTLAATLAVVEDPAEYLGGCPYPFPEEDALRGSIAFTGIFDYLLAAQDEPLREYLVDYFDADPELMPAVWTKASPATWVDGDEPPFLLIHGLADRNIDAAHTTRFAEVLEDAGDTVELLLVPDADHMAVTRSRESWAAVETFVTEVLAKPPAATGVGEEASEKEGKDLRITIVYDNTVYDLALRSAWGFSALIEYGDQTLLFDTGGDGPTLLGNMARLNIDPTTIEKVVLSHIHGDHTGGLTGLVQAGARPTVYVPPAFPDNFKRQISALTELVEVETGQEIASGMYTTGELHGGGVDEQALVVPTDAGLVVITGCAHPGIVRIVRAAKALFDAPVHLVLGGFHLGNHSAAQVEGILDEFRALGVARVSPMHCTGESAIAMFAEAYGDDYIQGGAGQVIVVEGAR